MADRQGPPSDLGSSGRPAVASRWPRTDNVLLVALLGVFVWITGDVLLLVFAGLLLAVGLDGLAGGVKTWTPLSRGWALLVVLGLSLAFFAAIGMTIVPQFLAQLDELWQRLSGFGDQAYQTLSRYNWVQQLMSDGEGQAADAVSALARQAASAMLALIGIVGSLVLVLAIAIFAAADPDLYRRGVLTLLPTRRRERVNETLSATGHALRWWFLAQIISMLVLGVTVSVGLMFIGVDLWLSLGVLTGLLTFIPVLGPIIAAVPIVIIGFTQGVQTGLIVLAFYLVVQNLEGNFLVPMIHHRVVNLAPVLLISVQVLMGTLFGLMGLIMAAPLTIVAMVFVKKLYVEDVLDEPRA
jgi:predicted PurR-regulated permease PerM